VLHEDAVRYTIAKFKAELTQRVDSTRSHLSVLREEREQLKTEIANLACVIASGWHSPALLAELEKRGESYKLSGEWNLVGEVRSDGAGGPDRTMVPLAQAC
jgi:hypothetical protein